MFRFLTLTMLGLGCATRPPPPSPPAPANESTKPESYEHGLPIPADLRPHIEQSLLLGHAIFFQDAASALGTDVLAENIGPPGSAKWDPLGGYLTAREGTDDGKPTGAWVVVFYTREAEPRLVYRVRLGLDRKEPPQFEAFQPPRDLPAGMSRLISARQAALATLENPVQPINPVVLPAELIGERGTLVYLLAGTKRTGVAVLGKHYRVLVGEDGKTVRKVEPLSNTILEMPPAPENAAGLFVTHLVTDWPLETHVFVSMQMKVPVFVITSRGIWRVTRDQIALVKEGSP